MTTAGPRSPAATATIALGATDWSNHANIKASDNSYAVAALNASSSYWLEASDFGFSIPAGATIDGIEIAWEGKCASGTQGMTCAIVPAAGTPESTPSGTVTFTTTEAYKTVGGPTDNPGSFTAADVNAAFRVWIRANFTAGTASISVDHVRVTVYYTAAQVMTPGVASLTVTRYAPTATASAHQVATPAKLSLALTSFAPTARTPRVVTPPKASLGLTGYAPSVYVGTRVTPGVADLTATGLAPTVTATEHKRVTPGAAALALAGKVPSVLLPLVVTPGVADLALTTYAVAALGDIPTSPFPLAASARPPVRISGVARREGS